MIIETELAPRHWRNIQGCFFRIFRKISFLPVSQCGIHRKTDPLRAKQNHETRIRNKIVRAAKIDANL